MLEALNVLCSLIFIFYSPFAFLSRALELFFLLSFPPLFFFFSFSFPSLLFFSPPFMFLLAFTIITLCFVLHLLLHVCCLLPCFTLCAVTLCSHLLPCCYLHFFMLLHVPCLLFCMSHLRSKVLVITPSSLLLHCLLLPCVSWYPAPFHVCR